MQISLTVNGKNYQVTPPPMKRLLDVLREDLAWIVSLSAPKLRLEQDRMLELELTVDVVGTAQTRIEALPGGPVPAQPPTLSVRLMASSTLFSRLSSKKVARNAASARPA